MSFNKRCSNCDLCNLCIRVVNVDYKDGCENWAGWIPRDYPPEVDEYVLIQLTEDYAGELDNICIGMYFPENRDWMLGHISGEITDADNIYAWRPLPKAIKEIKNEE